MNLVALLWHYVRTRRLRFTHREALETWQAKRLAHFSRYTLRHSPWFRPYLHQPFKKWPQMDKAQMMAHFDQMNTAGLNRDELLACALQSEQSRDFTPKVGRFSVGLSSGTSGQRGVFVVSPQEQSTWAGAVLAKMLPDGLFAGERVALFLRADNHLYQSVNNRWLTLAYFDLLMPLQEQLPSLTDFSPTIIVAPAQVLCSLAERVLSGALSLKVKKVISVAEVLDAHDKALLVRVFGDVGEIYQATEGFLAATCSHGTLHLNEEFLHVEPQWLDAHRFVPVITDFTRSTQPIVRYRLDDVLVAQEEACPCGSATRAIARIEGRHDDQLLLPGLGERPVTVFADACSRVIAQSLPLAADYQLRQTDHNALTLVAEGALAELQLCQDALNCFFQRQGVVSQNLVWSLVCGEPVLTAGTKRRRIVRQWRALQSVIQGVNG
ncbi:F390 synthetase-related protein [Mangrovibacter yixingensis]|uniref:F390 synthetase-related protein n=1 Tax=Mangrovibacter yixingensis TaxID=1529639 RepID=UPI001CFEC583|nr:F390 synthetase-related protein [Mangrovibacter yixingensis]